jgi:hypothetical protein
VEKAREAGGGDAGKGATPMGRLTRFALKTVVIIKEKLQRFVSCR